MLNIKETHPIKWQEARNEPAQEPDGEREQGKLKERRQKIAKSIYPRGGGRKKKEKSNEVLKEVVTKRPIEVIL